MISIYRVWDQLTKSDKYLYIPEEINALYDLQKYEFKTLANLINTKDEESIDLMITNLKFTFDNMKIYKISDYRSCVYTKIPRSEFDEFVHQIYMEKFLLGMFEGITNTERNKKAHEIYSILERTNDFIMRFDKNRYLAHKYKG